MKISNRLVRAGYACVWGLFFFFFLSEAAYSGCYIDATSGPGNCAMAGAGTFALLDMNHDVIHPGEDATFATWNVCLPSGCSAPSPNPPCQAYYMGYVTQTQIVCLAPNAASPTTQTYPVLDPSTQCGSTIRIDNQTVLESIPIVGAPFSLEYNSEHVKGNRSSYRTTLPIFTDQSSVPAQITGIDLVTQIEGQSSSTTSHAPSTGLATNYVWDGNDANGVETMTPRSLTVVRREMYTPEEPYVMHQSFGASYSGIYFEPIVLGNTHVEQFGLGGWIPSIFFFKDSRRNTVHWGSGRTHNLSEDFLFQEPYLEFSGVWPSAIKGPLLGNNLFTFGYSGGKLVSITDHAGNQTTFQYTNGKLSSITAPRGQVTQITTDANGYISSVQSPNGKVYSMTYSTQGLLETFEKPGGAVSAMAYDTDGNLVSDSSSVGSSVSLSRVVNSAANRTITSTSELGLATAHSLTTAPTNYTRQVTSANGSSSTYIQSKRFDLTPSDTTFSDSTGYFSTTSYNRSSWNYLETVYTGSGSQLKTVAYTREDSACVVPPCTASGGYDIKTSVNGKDYRVNYDGANQRIIRNTPLSRTTVEDLDSSERVIASQYETFTPVSYSYDTLGRLTGVSQGTTRTSTFAYHSGSGFLASITNALSQTTGFDYDLDGHVVKQTLPDSREILFSYDDDGNLTEIETPSGTVHAMTYNGHGYLTSYIAPLARKLGLEDVWHGLKKVIRKTANLFGVRSLTTTYTYDDDRRLVEIERGNGDALTFGYDATTGLRTSLTLPSGSQSYSYTYGDFPASQSSVDSIATTQGWAGHHIITETSAEGGSSRASTVNYTYNSNLGFASDIVTSNATTTGTTISYGYDDDGLLTTAGAQTLIRDANTGFLTQTQIGSNMKQFFGYTTTFGELSQIQAKYSTTVKYQQDLTRDDLGRVTGMTENYAGVSNSYVYTFDSAGRLTGVSKNGSPYSSYSYDANSNRTSQTINGVTTTATYDDQDRMETFGTYTFTYNDNGEMLSKTNSSPVENTSYSYDALGNLKSVTLPNGTVVTYKTDAQGRRITKKNGSTFKEYYVYDLNSRVVAILNSSGTVVFRFVYGSKSHVPDYMIKSGVTYQIVSNHLGSPVQVIRTSNGVVSQQITYDEWGKVTGDTSPGFQPFGFAGGLYDPDTKLTHFGAREYDASTGRWLTKDPILFAGGDTNLYGYVMQDPINLIDPSGNFAILLPFVPYLGEALFVGSAAVVGWAMSKLLPIKGPPNGSIVVPDASTGGKKQERFYGPNGDPVKDFDWGHDHGAGSPHVHDWEIGPDGRPVRGKGRAPGEGECK